MRRPEPTMLAGICTSLGARRPFSDPEDQATLEHPEGHGAGDGSEPMMTDFWP